MELTTQPPALPFRASRRVAFDDFEFDFSSFQLWRAGEPVLLQPQPGRLLALLISRRGETVSRREIRVHLWGTETHVDYEQAINFAIRKIRIGLQDHASTPRFIETVPRAGYRFLASVRELPFAAEPAGLDPSLTAEATVGTSSNSVGKGRKAPWILAVGGLLLTAMSIVLLWSWRSREEVRGPGSRDQALVELPTSLDPNALDLFLEGRHLVSTDNAEKVQTGVDKLAQVLELEPDLAQAHLAWAEGFLSLGGHHKFEAFMPRVEEAARRAVDLEPDLWQGHLLLARVLFFYRHRWSEAEAAVEEALRLEPNAAETLQLRGVMEAARGRHSRAMELVKRAREIDPAAILVRSDLAFCRLYAGDLEGALALTEAILEIEPAYLMNAYLRGTILLMLDDPRAQDALTSVVSVADFPSLEATLEWHISSVELQREAGLRSHFSLALLQALADRPALSLDLLRQACAEDRTWELPFVRVDPRFATVRRQPGFSDLDDCFPPLLASDRP